MSRQPINGDFTVIGAIDGCLKYLRFTELVLTVRESHLLLNKTQYLP